MSSFPGYRLWPVVSLFHPSENLSLAKAEIRPHPHIGDLAAFHVRVNRLHVNPDERILRGCGVSFWLGLRKQSGKWVPGAWVYSARHCFYTASMAVMVEVQHTGCVPVVRSGIGAIIEHALADRPGDWRVSIIGSQANDLAFFDFFPSDLCVWQGCSESATLFLDVPVRVSAAWMHL